MIVPHLSSEFSKNTVFLNEYIDVPNSVLLVELALVGSAMLIPFDFMMFIRLKLRAKYEFSTEWVRKVSPIYFDYPTHPDWTCDFYILSICSQTSINQLGPHCTLVEFSFVHTYIMIVVFDINIPHLLS